MRNIFERVAIKFDENESTTISKKKLEYLLQQTKLGNLYFDESRPSDEGYLLIENNSNDFYPFPLDELDEWENDGSCLPGDSLFKLTFIKKY